MSREVTLKDVAARAGVSRTTASNVMSGGGRFSPGTREKVHRAMRELGYVYNRGAASLRTQRTRTVGIVVTHIASPFLGELLVGLEAAFTKAGFLSMVVATADDSDRQEALVSELREQRIAALAMVPASGTTPEFIESLSETGLPHVLMTRYVEEATAPYVGPDDVVGGGLAATHLLGHECRSFAYIGGPQGMLSRRDRIEGVRRALDDGRIGTDDLRDIPAPSTGQGGLWAGERLLERGPLPEGIICHSDSVAFGVYRALRSRGREQEIRLIGYDNVSTAALWEPPLTSVATKPEVLGRESARVILEQLGEEATAILGSTSEHIATAADGTSLMLQPELRIRQSCGCPALL